MVSSLGTTQEKDHDQQTQRRTSYVLGKDEALDFYVGKLGLEKGNDVKQGDYQIRILQQGEAAAPAAP